jgi:hypothetical protein
MLTGAERKRTILPEQNRSFTLRPANGLSFIGDRENKILPDSCCLAITSISSPLPIAITTATDFRVEWGTITDARSY